MVHVKEKKADNLLEILAEIFRYRELLFSLSVRSIKVQYKQSFLGIAWAVFIPFSTMLIFVFINKAKIINIDTGNIPYPIFAYCGLLPWSFFAGSLGSGTQSLVSYSGLIDKIYFPREILPLSLIFSKVIDLAIASLILVGLMLFYKVKLHITIIAVPLVLLVQIILVAGLSFVFSIGNLFYRDVGYIISGVVPLLMFVTPVVYPIKVASKQLQGFLLSINPMIPIIDAYRDLILIGRWPDLAKLAIPIVLCFIIFFMGLLWFHKNEHLFAENI